MGEDILSPLPTDPAIPAIAPVLVVPLQDIIVNGAKFPKGVKVYMPAELADSQHAAIKLVEE
jgi:hypothetical protein